MSAVLAPRWSFEGAFHDAAGGLALIGMDGRWLAINDAACDLLGRSRTHLEGRFAAGACELEDAVTLIHHIESAIDGGPRAFDLELRMPRLDGSRSWLRLQASVIPDPRGAPGYLAATLHDVTEQRRAREERDAFFDLCPDPLAIATHDGVIQRVNRAWEVALGWSSEEMRAQPFIELVHPDDRERTAAESERTFAGQATPRFRNRYKVKSGGYRWLEWQVRLGGDGRMHAIARDVTEQQQAMIIFEAEMKRRRQRLDEAEQRLDVHVNNTPLAVVEFDARLRVRRWSARAEALFGWAEEEVIGDRPDQWRFIHEDDADIVATAMLSLVTGEAPSQIVRNRNYTRDGRVVHCEWFMSAVFDDAGHLLSMLAFAQDVTARVQAEAEAAEREALFRATFEQAPVGIAHVGLDGRWLRVNRTLCEFLGHPVDTLLDLSFQDITHPDDLDRDLALVQQVLDGQLERYEIRKRYLHRDGHVLWAHLTVSLRRDAEGRPLHFISVVEDIAATVEAEQTIRDARDELEVRVIERTRELESTNLTLAVEVEQRRDAESALRESELRIRTILENSHDAFIACEDDGRIAEWNRAAEAVFGWRRTEVIGRSLGEMIVPPALRQPHEAGMARFLAGGDARVLDQRLQLPARHRNGHEFPVEMTISLVRLGRRRLFTAFLHDISERVAAERQLRESEARLRTITDNVTAMIAYVGPDLHYRFANGAYADWFGRDDADIAGLHMRDVLGDENMRMAQPFVDRVLAGEQVNFDRVRISPDGDERHVTFTYIPDGTSTIDGGRGFFVAAHDVSMHKRLAQVLEHRALSDELTGLPNRAAWTRALNEASQRAAREAVGTAVMFLDLDGFKRVNDTHGHEVGDAVLREFAARLRRCVGGGDLVARLSGDEFVILLQQADDVGSVAEHVAASIAIAMRPAFEIGELRLSMAGSIGIAVQRDGAVDGARLMREADEAMYETKRTRDGMPFRRVELVAAN
ncbi:PAS domain S-box protein [Lysobacter sp. TY2-98]|uniref:bifunctional diguanylate cyclase/phosphodiesterase n=1 Tax=Lysobacter sp. TY2-98 TaxID=2290922 RepID=UPI000E207654|nr:PAS domain S-box protein [Lysobacter sp. TY2-98]AXK73317.1 PAS domain S-box protein [Lysobacter sp. TY2-98]